ncbi:MAG: bifunctional enoyl-CoA hydratase/phosphate acetyltransferase [Gammaproteobacteria bacterium]
MLSTDPVEVPKALLAQAQSKPAVVAAVANAGSEIVMESAQAASAKGLMTPVLVGDPDAIKRKAKDLRWDLNDVRIERVSGEQQAAECAVALARNDEVSAIIKGDVHTDVLLRAVLNREFGLRTPSLLSHVFHMTVPGSDRPLCITDAVLNVDPTLEQKQHILDNAVSLLHALGNSCPRIALLSATETPTEAMPSSLEAAQLCERAFQKKRADALIDGPLAFDLAVSTQAARTKHVDGGVAGQADVILVPNIETGNALFKMMVYFRSAAAAGIVLGAKVPVMLTSRADPLAARVASAALTSVYAASLRAAG